MIEKDVPELRIVSDELWARVKARQQQVSFTVTGAAKLPWDRRRPRYLLSGLAKCGACGGGFVTISQTHMGCATARNKGMCDNRLAIARDKLEATVLAGLRHHLMAPDLFKEFCDAYISEVNRARMGASADRAAAEAELAKIKRRLRRGWRAGPDLEDELLALEAREDVLKAKLEATPEQKVLLNPVWPRSTGPASPTCMRRWPSQTLIAMRPKPSALWSRRSCWCGSTASLRLISMAKSARS